MWLQFSKWKDQYGELLRPYCISQTDRLSFIGPVIYLNLLGQPVIVLNTVQAVEDLLEKRSRIYSARPRFIIVSFSYLTFRSG